MEKEPQIPKGCWLWRSASQLGRVAAPRTRALTDFWWVECGCQLAPAYQTSVHTAPAEYKLVGIQLAVKNRVLEAEPPRSRKQAVSLGIALAPLRRGVNWVWPDQPSLRGEGAERHRQVQI